MDRIGACVKFSVSSTTRISAQGTTLPNGSDRTILCNSWDNTTMTERVSNAWNMRSVVGESPAKLIIIFEFREISKASHFENQWREAFSLAASSQPPDWYVLRNAPTGLTSCPTQSHHPM